MTQGSTLPFQLNFFYFMSDTPLYFDTAASTRIAPEILARMVELLKSDNGFANPSSIAHLPGQTAEAIVDVARTEIAVELGCETNEVVFTSGATEANNLAVRGVALAFAAHGRHIVTSAIEHKSVMECCAFLEREGYEVTYLHPNSKGWIEPEAIRNAIRDETLLVSLMHTNNETGVMQPIGEVAEAVAEAGILFHVDAAQAVGKFSMDLQKLPIDLLSLSGHKFHGPKGVGCLVVRNRRKLRLQPLMYGGGQEFGLRPGTLAIHQIVGLSTALTLAATRYDTDLAHVTTLKQTFIEQLTDHVSLQVHGDQAYASPYIVNFSIAGISSDALINQLAAEVAIASGSACSSGTIDPSYVLRAMGIEGDALHGAVRVSFDRNHSYEEISFAVARIVAAVRRMQELIS